MVTPLVCNEQGECSYGGVVEQGWQCVMRMVKALGGNRVWCRW